MKLDEAKQHFIQSWGTLGSNWGVNRTMAQIHALLLVSNEPISTEDMMEQLQISRGNANMNTRTLIEWGIVTKTHIPGERKEFFVTDKDIWALARQVVKQRRQREIEPMLRVLQEVKNVEGNDKETKEFKGLIDDIDSFTQKADDLMDKFIRSDEHWFYRQLLKMV
ncbi:MAG: GbsR/MarR family transcriptional regulator [Fluviicola sp.]